METVEVKLNESLEPAKSPESQMAEHQVKTYMWEIEGEHALLVYL